MELAKYFPLKRELNTPEKGENTLKESFTNKTYDCTSYIYIASIILVPKLSVSALEQHGLH